jgi:hypothetical protein
LFRQSIFPAAYEAAKPSVSAGLTWRVPGPKPGAAAAERSHGAQIDGLRRAAKRLAVAFPGFAERFGVHLERRFRFLELLVIVWAVIFEIGSRMQLALAHES